MESNPTVNPSVNEMTLDNVSFRVSEVRDTWKIYNLSEADLVFGTPGNFFESNYKAIVRTVNGALSPVAIVSRDYVLLPNEEVIRIANQLMPQYNLSLYEEQGRTQSHFAREGNSMFLYYFPDNEHNGSAFEREIIPGDNIKLGVSLRNSIDGSIGFGVDSFSYRGLCWNGSIQQKQGAMSVYRKHTAGLKDILPTLTNLIESVLAEGDHLVQFYKRLAGIELTPEIADVLTNSYLPKKYLPWDIEEISLENGKTIKSPILSTLKTDDRYSRISKNGLSDSNLWSIYNHITGALWHNDRTNPQSKNLMYSALGKTFDRALQLVEVKAR